MRSRAPAAHGAGYAVLQDLLECPPSVHCIGGQKSAYGIAWWALQWLWDHVHPGMVTLETGLGLSTAVFALRGAVHICITPSSDEVISFQQYAADRRISIDTVHFRVDRSENVLPALTTPKLQIALIDGRHGFPAPMIDWFYIAERMVPNGHVLVDNTDIWPVHVLVEYLDRAEDWSKEAAADNIALYRYLGGASHNAEWDAQPYVVLRSRPSAAAVWRRRGTDYASLLAQGRFGEAMSRLRRWRCSRHQ